MKLVERAGSCARAKERDRREKRSVSHCSERILSTTRAWMDRQNYILDSSSRVWTTAPQPPTLFSFLRPETFDLAEIAPDLLANPVLLEDTAAEAIALLLTIFMLVAIVVCTTSVALL